MAEGDPPPWRVPFANAMMWRAAVAAAGLALMSACGSDAVSTPTPSPSASPTACTALPASVGPDVAGSLDQTNSGGTFCLPIGQKLNVFLSVPLAQADNGRWTQVKASDHSVLQGVPSGALTLVRGVTAGIFAGAHAGTSVLSSTRPPCTATTAVACPSGQGWQVTIVVKG